MADFYTVSNSFRAKDRDGNPKSWDSQYGTFDVWNIYFEGDDTKYQVNKKQGFEGFRKGQQLYGTKTQGQYGGQFKQEQAPEGVRPQSSAQPSGSVEEKLDYIISLLENMAGSKDGDRLPSHDEVERPVDLSEIPF